MSNVRPFMGYPSRSEAALRLREVGNTWEEVAQIMSLSDRKAAASLARYAARKQGFAIRCSVTMSDATRSSLKHEAETRGLSFSGLSARLLAILAKEPVLLANLLDEADNDQHH